MGGDTSPRPTCETTRLGPLVHEVVTYNSVIAACERAWKWTTALHLFTVMRKDRDAYEVFQLLV